MLEAREPVRSVPSQLPVGTHLLEPIIDRAEHNPSQVVTAVRHGDRFIGITAQELYGRVRALAKGLIERSVEPGDRVAVMSHTRLEWLLLDYAILAVGAVTVPIYETSSADQVHWILADSGAVLAVVETPTMLALVGTIDDARAPRAEGLREVLVIDDGGVDDLVARGRGIDDELLDHRIASIAAGDIATIIYTSGTTGRPKGCVLTHGNLRSNVIQNIDAVHGLLGNDERTLLFLPLAHSFARIIAFVGSEWGVVGMFATDMTRLAEELSLAKPTMIVAVPRVFEKVFSAAQRQSRLRHRGWIFDRACTVAIRFSRERLLARPTVWTRAEHAVYERLVYRKIRAAMGGSLRFAFSGGSPLGERLTYFFDGIGVRIFEGYGLTETSPTLTVNRVGAWRPGTVGQPLTGTELRIAPDGEIQAKGPQIFAGYWGDGEATASVFTDDGWFRTGDIGVIEDGFLRITGRQKELIVTAGGKNVAPAPIEDRLRAAPLVSQAVVVGDNRPFVTALVTIDDETFATWKVGRLDATATVADAVNDPALRRELQDAVDAANAPLSRPESIRAFAILPRDLTVADGELTPTMKIRRHVVEVRYADTIDQLYAQPDPGKVST